MKIYNPEFRKLGKLFFKEKIKLEFYTPETNGWCYRKDVDEFVLYKDGYFIQAESPKKSEYREPLPGFKGSLRYHRLDGPAIIFWDQKKFLFMIKSRSYSEEDYWTHPLVQQNKLAAILKGLTNEKY